MVFLEPILEGLIGRFQVVSIEGTMHLCALLGSFFKLLKIGLAIFWIWERFIPNKFGEIDSIANMFLRDRAEVGSGWWISQKIIMCREENRCGRTTFVHIWDYEILRIGLELPYLQNCRYIEFFAQILRKWGVRNRWNGELVNGKMAEIWENRKSGKWGNRKIGK